jgi:hypothetical protein
MLQRTKIVGFLCAGAVILNMGAARLRAQATAAIVGTVTDISGAGVPDASIQVKNSGTGVVQATTADLQGRFRVPELIIGEYEVSAAKMGFSTVVRKGITLTVGAQPVVDFQLPIGQQQQTVTVEAAVSLVETQSTAIGALVESEQIRDLPLNGRNYTQLLTLNPGVIPVAAGAPGAGSTFYGNGTKYSISGSRPSAQAYLLDGQDMTNFWNNGPGAGGLGTALGVEAISEFQALTNTYSSQYGGNGAVINSSTRSGTNGFHGSAYEYVRNNKLEARNFYDTIRQPGHTTAEPPVFRQNQYGGSVGGPIKKDKAFFFVNYEALRRTQVVTSVVTVPDGCAHQFLNTLPTGACGAPVTENSNPTARQAVRNVMALYPLPGYAPELFAANGVASATGQALVEDPNIGTEHYVVGRIDYTISDKSALFFRYALDHADRDFTTGIPYWGELDRTRDHFVTVEERHVITPRLVNLARAGFSRTFEDAYVYGSPVVANGAPSPGTLATQGVHPLQFFSSDRSSVFYAAPREDGSVVPGSGITTIAASSTLPFYLVPNKFSFGDDVIWTSGAHNIKTGASFMRLRENTWAPFVVAPQWTFLNLTSFMAGNAATVNGQVSDNQYPGSDATKDYRYWVFAPYFEDQWKVTKKLSVTLGLRYSPTTRIGNVRHRELDLRNAPFGLFEELDQATAVNPSLRNWDPRVGLAWDPFPNHKTSIRAGFGAFHSVLFSRDTNHWLQPPFLTVLQTTTSTLNGAPAPVQFPLPWTNVPMGSGTVPTNGTLSCTNCNYYGRTTTPYQMQWNFNIQREVMADTVVMVSYVGSRGLHLPAQKDFNTPVPVTGPSGRPTFGVLTGTGAAAAVVANPRVNPAYAYLQLMDGLGDSTYHALQTSLNRRFSRGWQAQVSYTFSKSIDDTSGSYGLDGGGATYNPTNVSADRGLSNFNRAQNFRVSGTYSLPFRAHGVLGQVVGGWDLSGGYTYLSGLPFAVGTIANRVHNSAGQAAARPDAVAGCDLYSGYQQLHGVWFNPNCFVPGPFGTYGNAGRDTIVGPNLWGMDAALHKDFKITKISEQLAVQFRAEAFNILNHPTFQNPNASPFVASLASANPANPSSGVVPNGSAGLITATNSQPRQLQLALKIVF